jgi:hypothetical protein
VALDEALLDTSLDEAMDLALTQYGEALKARGVRVDFAATGLRVHARPTALGVQLGLVLQHCVDAPNAEGAVRISAVRQGSSLTLVFEGANVPSTAQTGPLSSPRNSASNASLALLAAASLGELDANRDAAAHVAGSQVAAGGNNGAVLIVAHDGQPRLALRLVLSSDDIAGSQRPAPRP